MNDSHLTAPSDGNWLGHGNAWRIASTIAMLAVLSALHYSTPVALVVLHETYSYACYVPIVLGAYWYGVRGGIIVALAATTAFIPHVHAGWSHNAPYLASQYAQAVAFHVVGITVGVLMQRQRRLTERYRDAAHSLEGINAELRASQDQLRHAERLATLGEIAAGLAHEIGNPLASIRGALDILAGRAVAGSPEAEFTHVGQKEIDRLDRLITEFLTYARPRNPVRRPVRIGDLVDHTLTLLQAEAAAKDVSLRADTADRELLVLADAEQIVQVLINVALNAVQATPPGSTVRITSFADDCTAIVGVQDEGAGIAEADAARIFEPFFTTKAKGSGLGLATSHRIVTAHGGAITAAAASPSGTIFYIRLPLAPES